LLAHRRRRFFEEEEAGTWPHGLCDESSVGDLVDHRDGFHLCNGIDGIEGSCRDFTAARYAFREQTSQKKAVELNARKTPSKEQGTNKRALVISELVIWESPPKSDEHLKFVVH
jgi:hypothetical protein